MKGIEKKKGFTLVEMLVVIGIIAILCGALMVGFGSVTKSAQRAKAQAAVHDAATALQLYFDKHGGWSEEIKTAAAGERKMNAEVAKALAKYKLLNINSQTVNGEVTLLGTDRLGILDPWGIATLKRSRDASLGTSVSSGGTVTDHMLYFAIDEDDDGITEARLDDGVRRIRAKAVVWGAGQDGKLAPYAESGRSDDVYSWQRGQEVK